MVDFGHTAQDYARHRAGFPPSFIVRLALRGLISPGGRALDLGAGTGALALDLAKSGLQVSALDVSAAMLSEAGRRAEASGLELALVEAPAESTGLADASFELVTAGQCWHWFDRPRAAAEVFRLLVPGGALVIAHLDWLSFSNNIVERTLATVEDFGGRWPAHVLELAHHGIYPAWTQDARTAGFVEIETLSFDVDLAYSKEDWRGRIRASAAVGGSLDPEAVADCDAELERRLGDDPDQLRVPHRVFALSCHRPR